MATLARVSSMRAFTRAGPRFVRTWQRPLSTALPPQEEYKHKILRGGALAKKIFDQASVDSADLRAAGWPPKLLSVSVGDEDASQVYIRNQKRIAEKVGIDFEHLTLPADISLDEILVTIAAKNADPRVTGIIIQRPVPKHLDVKRVQQAVHPLKDVEGMHPTSLGQVVYNEADLAPCTARAAVEMLRATNLELPGLKVCVVGHSEIVGKPISFLLMTEGCTVTVCHHMTRDLGKHTRQADAVMVAVGKIGLVDGSMIKPGAAVIDIGINQVEGGKVVGDVDFKSVLVDAGWVTPVPGGVGTVTTAVLMQNAITAAKRQQQHYGSAFGSNHEANNAAYYPTL